MEQTQKQVLAGKSHHAMLDAAAEAVSATLTARQKKHGFFGGYATSLLGGNRMTHDVDVIIGENPQAVREQLLQDDRFSVTAGNKLKFNPGPEAPSDAIITVEMLQGGAQQQLKLPDANNVPLVWVNPIDAGADRVDCEIPVIHPSPLVLTKIKRWMFIAESTRPASIKKASNDLDDIETILQYMVGNDMAIDFTMYPEKSKEDLLPGFQMLLGLVDRELPDLVQKALTPEDFQAIQ